MVSNDPGKFLILLLFLIPIVFVIYVGASGWRGGGSSRFEDINEGFRSTGDIILYVVLGIVGFLLLIWLISTGLGHK